MTPQPSNLVPSRTILWVCRLLCATALVISGYLAWTAFTATEVYGCGGGESAFDCGHVLTSRFSKIFSIPVSVPAVAMYASLLGGLFFLRSGVPESLLKASWGLLTVGAFSAGLAAMWFGGIQLSEWKFCAYCLTAHACGLTLAAILLWKHPLGWGRTLQLSGISVLGVAGLMTGQMMADPPVTYTVERYDDADVPSASTHLTSFGAPQEFSPTDDIEAPMEFAPPTEFAPPIEFSPPTEFAPPADTIPAESEDPVVTETSPPIHEDASSGQPKSRSTETAIPTRAPDASSSEDNTTSSLSNPSDTMTVTTATKMVKRKTVRLPVAAGAGALLLAPRSNKVAIASRLLAMFVGQNATAAEATQSSTDDSAAEATVRRAARPVVAAVPERLVTVAGDRFSLNTRHWPLLGDPDAKYIFVEMFDYTCPHCRNTHHAIEGAKKRYGNDLAIIALPVPLERACNDAASGAGHPGACEMAKLAIAVWRCDRTKFSEFHNWMFQGHRSTAQARTKAQELVGKQQLDTELALPHAGNYVSKHVELYKRVGKGAVPKLMFPKSTMTGSVGSAETLVTTIKQELGQ
ncbi:MAG: vitamin K epoxide reductase family protein [Planctomycetaceae bacterium]